jgi:putative tricarboxylic transport membrane protein
MAFRAMPLLSLCFLVLAAAYLADGLRLPLGSADRPGAGVYPLLVGILLFCLSLFLLIGSLKRKATLEEAEPFPRGPDLKRVVAVGVSLALFVVLLKPLGYLLCSALLMAATLRLLELTDWKRIVLISGISAALSHYLFSRLLGVPLPLGVFFS